MNKSSLKKFIIGFLSVVIFLALVLLFFIIGEKIAFGFERFVPSYEKIDLQPFLEKDSLTDEDYITIYAQTGLSKIGFDGMLETYGKDKILETQDAFFTDYKIIEYNFAPFCHYYSIGGVIPSAPLKRGDIIISSSTEFSLWSVGHCAMVVDVENGRTVEAIGIGDVSTYGYVSPILKRGNFVILRPKADDETVESIVSYVEENLIGIKYDPTIGVLSRKYDEEIEFTQCAHIFWYAFYKHGIDIDSNGGTVVTPKDILWSDQFDIVQISGFDPDRLWD